MSKAYSLSARQCGMTSAVESMGWQSIVLTIITSLAQDEIFFPGDRSSPLTSPRRSDHLCDRHWLVLPPQRQECVLKITQGLFELEPENPLKSTLVQGGRNFHRMRPQCA